VKIWRVVQGFYGGLYTLEEARRKKQNYQQSIDEANTEIIRLKSEIRGFTQQEIEVLRQELKVLRDTNLEEATFDEKVDLIAKLGLKVYPSEDLKSRRISCHLPLRNNMDVKEQVGVAKEVFGRPCRSRTCDTLIKRYRSIMPRSIS
jgi:uncharacterized protein YoxC